MMRRALHVCAAVIAMTAGPVVAQAPDDAWRSIRTEHFVVHFPAALESLARRAAGEAERAWVRLVAELAPPRTPVELVVTDERDISNGQATYSPSNRIVVWAHPPVDNPSLRFSDDWLQQVVTHELAHVFHLDRTRGLWRMAQRVFGRHPALFPNARSPRWLTEGIAVAFESELVGGGRLNGSELHATLTATDLAGRTRTPDRLSLATPYAPGGHLAYFAGSLLVAESIREGIASGAGAGGQPLREFVDRVAAFPIPYLWDIHARRAFGRSFTALAARSTPRAVEADDDVSLVVVGDAFWDARAPRWRGDTVFFVASGPRERTGLFAAFGGRLTRVADRNATDAFAFGRDGIVHGDLDYVDPYRLWSALYRDGERIRGSDRLSAPDVNASGTVVAVDARGGSATLALVMPATTNSADAGGPAASRVLLPASSLADVSDPRWSRSGTLIAAARWHRGGESEIVVLDTTGTVLASYARARAVQRQPSWDVADRAIYFTSDRGGQSAIYRIALAGPDSGRVFRVPSGALSVYDAEVSPDGRTLAALRTGPDGVQLVLLPTGPGTDAAPGSVFRAGLGDAPADASGGRVTRYRPWRTLVPRYWVPTLGSSGRDNALLGAYVRGEDVVGQTSFTAEVQRDLGSGEMYGNGSLTYRGLGRPVLAAGYAHSWTIFPVVDDGGGRLGDVARRSRAVSLAAGWTRQRVRNVVTVSAGGDVEWRDFRVAPDTLAQMLTTPVPANALAFPSLTLSAGWSNARRSALGIGPEQGGSLTASARRRWRNGAMDSTVTHTLVGQARYYLPLPFPGHALHTLALRAAVARADAARGSAFAVGGVSGTTVELFPGYTIGDGARTFFVRGFESGALSGPRAWGAGAEYRAPLAAVGRGLWPFPLFFQRAALAAFTDAASAWCPPLDAATPVCRAGRGAKPVIASAGAELLLDLAYDYDSPTRFRLGYAVPVRKGPADLPAASPASGTLYFSLGLPF